VGEGDEEMNNTPAFPSHVWDDDYERYFNTGGMTLRDYFAARAMQGAMSGCSARGEVIMYSDLAGLSYEVADAMMKAREA
jgi:hypothetical protein